MGKITLTAVWALRLLPRNGPQKGPKIGVFGASQGPKWGRSWGDYPCLARDLPNMAFPGLAQEGPNRGPKWGPFPGEYLEAPDGRQCDLGPYTPPKGGPK